MQVSPRPVKGARGGHGPPLLPEQPCDLQEAEAKLLVGSKVMYTVGYCLSLGALLLALAILLGLRYGRQAGGRGAAGRMRAGTDSRPHRKLHCTRNYIHVNLFASFMLKAGSVLVIDLLLKTRYSQEFGDHVRVRGWMSAEVSARCAPAGRQARVGGRGSGSRTALPQALAGCRVAAVFMQYGIVANACWLLVEGLYLHRLLRLYAGPGPERSVFAFYLGIGWGEWAAAAGMRVGGRRRELGPQLPPSPRRRPHAVRHPLGCGEVCVREHPVSRSCSVRTAAGLPSPGAGSARGAAASSGGRGEGIAGLRPLGVSTPGAWDGGHA